MKKLLVLFLMTFLVLPANAYYVNYHNYGGYNRINSYGSRSFNNNANNFGSNAAFLPQNIERAERHQRQIEYERKYLDSLKNSQNINVNVNHNGYPITTYHYANEPRYNSYYTNTYYNNGYRRYGYTRPHNGIYYNNGNTITIPGVRMF